MKTIQWEGARLVIAGARRVLICLGCVLVQGAWAGEADALLAKTQALRSQGEVHQAIQLLQQAGADAGTSTVATRIAVALGATLTQARRFHEAQEVLDAAHRNAADTRARAGASLALGNLALLRKQTDLAAQFYAQVVAEPAAASADVLAARINLARMAHALGRPEALAALLPQIADLSEASARVPLLLHLGQLAAQSGAAAVPIAHAALARARRDTLAQPSSRPHLAALEGLAQLYEQQGRLDETLRLGHAALDAARAVPLRSVQDLLMAVEWRQARAWRQRGDVSQALAAAMRAVEHAQAVRPDLPIETADGRSTYQTVLQPLLELFVDLQLGALDSLPPARQAAALKQVREAVEAMRQSEMQDFLGDRCTVEEADAAVLEAGALALYPVLLPDRIELLSETRDGLRRVTQPVPRAQVVAATRELARALRNGHDGYLGPARRLYDWLVRPMESALEGRHTLVVVPDGPLRLVPFAALNDGEQPLLRRIAVSTVTGMSMTEAARPRTGRLHMLLAGVAVPGPVVEKIAVNDVLRAAPAAASRSPALAQRAARSASRALDQRNLDAMREALALPGVRDEVVAIAALTEGKVLLDGAFTLGAFEREVEGGDYRVVHIASHGVFGGSAQSSYILAFDDLLGISRLQGVLRSERLQQSPIDLLTLSACETAEGNDRAPLGIAGAAMSARARSVLGTLWPVDDEAAREVMEHFYHGLTDKGLSKAQALRAAQLELLAQPATRHPYFWAPFNLVGNWR